MIVDRSKLGTWLGQVTTGGGVVLLIKAVGDLAQGASIATVWPTLLMALVAMIWPENTAAQAAGKQLVTDAQALVAAAENTTATSIEAKK